MRTKKVMSKLNKKLTNYKNKIYSFLLTKVQLTAYFVSKQVFLLPKQLLNQIYYFQKKYGLYLVTTLYFIIFALLCVAVGKNIDINFLKSVSSEMFWSVGAIVGGSIAVVSSFSILIVQNAAENYPRDFYRVASSIKTKLIILLLLTLIVVLAFVTGIIYAQISVEYQLTLLVTNLYFLGASFYLIFLLFYSVRSDINPNKILQNVYYETKKSLDVVYKSTEGYAKVMAKHPHNRKIGAKTNELMAGIFQSPSFLQQRNNLTFRLMYLFDYHDSLLDKKESSSARDVLTMIDKIVAHYLHIRKDSAVILRVQDSLFALTSDSGNFLQQILERMNRLSMEYVKADDARGIIAVFGIYYSWLQKASEINYVGGNIYTNPDVEKVSGNFAQLVDNIVNIGNQEGLYQATSFYKDAIKIAVNKSYTQELHNYVDKLVVMIEASVKYRHEPVIQNIFEAYTMIISELLRNAKKATLSLEKVLDSLYLSTLYVYSITTTNTMRDSLLITHSVAKPYTALVEEIRNSKLSNKEALEVAKLLQKNLRNIADKTSSHNHFSTLTFAKAIREVGVELIKRSGKERNKYLKEALTKQAGWYIFLPEFFVPSSGPIDDNQELESLTEAIGLIGLNAITLSYTSLTKDCIEALDNIVNKMLNSEKKGKGAVYAEPKIMSLVGYLGILAKKQGYEDLSKATLEKIKNFEKTYGKAYFSDVPEGYDPYDLNPAPNQVTVNLKSLEDKEGQEFRDTLNLQQTCRALLLKKVDSEDIVKYNKSLPTDRFEM